MKNEVISTSVPAEVAAAIRRLAAAEDRTVSKVAGLLLLASVAGRPFPTATFARRGRRAQGKAEVRT